MTGIESASDGVRVGAALLRIEHLGCGSDCAHWPALADRLTAAADGDAAHRRRALLVVRACLEATSPPAYTRFVGEALLEHLAAEAAA